MHTDDTVCHRAEDETQFFFRLAAPAFRQLSGCAARRGELEFVVSSCLPATGSAGCTAQPEESQVTCEAGTADSFKLSILFTALSTVLKVVSSSSSIPSSTTLFSYGPQKA